MQKPSIIEKKILLWDGVEIPGLIKVAEMKKTKKTAKSPGYYKERDVSSEVTMVPNMECTYKVDRGTITQKFFNDFFEKRQVKDCTEVRTDQNGVPIERRLWQMCECIDHRTPPYDAENPEIMSVTVIVAPWDIKTINIA
jgi:hypothetical protein